MKLLFRRTSRRERRNHLKSDFLSILKAGWFTIMEKMFASEYRSWHPDIEELTGTTGFDRGSVFFAVDNDEVVGAVFALSRIVDGK